MEYTLRHPEYLRAIGRDGSESYGCDQRWYRTKWQQMAGCGPTTASTILIYLQKSGRIRLPVEVQEQHECIELMEKVWNYVRPTARGVYLAEQFSGGIQKFAAAHDFQIGCEALSIRGGTERTEERNLLRAMFIKPLFKPQSVEQTDDFSRAVAFIADGLSQDSPVAFLNLDSGDADHVDDWHWMTIISLTTGPDGAAEVKIIDGPKILTLDLCAWFRTTQLGGSLVYLVPKDGQGEDTAEDR